jgi:hypothetical protein
MRSCVSDIQGMEREIQKLVRGFSTPLGREKKRTVARELWASQKATREKKDYE